MWMFYEQCYLLLAHKIFTQKLATNCTNCLDILFAFRLVLRRIKYLRWNILVFMIEFQTWQLYHVWIWSMNIVWKCCFLWDLLIETALISAFTLNLYNDIWWDLQLGHQALQWMLTVYWGSEDRYEVRWILGPENRDNMWLASINHWSRQTFIYFILELRGSWISHALWGSNWSRSFLLQSNIENSIINPNIMCNAWFNSIFQIV